MQLTQVLYEPVVPGHVREGEGGLFVSSSVKVTPEPDLKGMFDNVWKPEL